MEPVVPLALAAFQALGASQVEPVVPQALVAFLVEQEVLQA